MLDAPYTADYPVGRASACAELQPRLASAKNQTFAKRSWGGEWPPDFAPRPSDVVVKEHTHVIVIGLLANTCIETAAKFAAGLGCHVTLVRNRSAAFSQKRIYAANGSNGPVFAHAILTTGQSIASVEACL